MELIAEIRKSFANNFRVEADLRLHGEAPILILFGPSGSGKTTILRCIAGLESMNGGAVVCDGVDWTNVSPQQRPVGYVFQEYALFPHLDAAANIGYGIRRLDAVERNRRMARVTSMLKIEALLKCTFFHLSWFRTRTR